MKCDKSLYRYREFAIINLFLLLHSTSTHKVHAVCQNQFVTGFEKRVLYSHPIFELSRGITLPVVELKTPNLHSRKINDRESIVQNFKSVV